MKLEIPVKPLSVNDAYTGRRFKTPEYKQFEIDLCKVVPVGKYDQNYKGDVYIFYVFYLSEYGNSDAANMEKIITDFLVKRDHLNDDRYIRMNAQRKERVPKGMEGIIAYICTSPMEYLLILEKYLVKKPL